MYVMVVNFCSILHRDCGGTKTTAPFMKAFIDNRSGNCALSKSLWRSLTNIPGQQRSFGNKVIEY